MKGYGRSSVDFGQFLITMCLRILLRIIKYKKANELFKGFLSKFDSSSMNDMELVLRYVEFRKPGTIKPLLRIKVKVENYTNY